MSLLSVSSECLIGTGGGSVLSAQGYIAYYAAYFLKNGITSNQKGILTFHSNTR